MTTDLATTARPTTPRLKPHYRVEVMDLETVYLLGELGHTALRGALFARIVPLLDGWHSLAELHQHAADLASPLAVRAAVAHLGRRGLLCAPAPEMGESQAAFWSAQDVAPGDVRGRLRSRPVEVHGDVPLRAPLVAALSAIDVQVVDGATAGGALRVHVVEDYLAPDLAEANRVALASGRPWMLVKPTGTQVWLGPVFRPGATACWQCLATRLSANRLVETSVRRSRGPGAVSVGPPRATLASTASAAHQLAATHICRWLVADADELDGTLLSLDVTTLTTTRHVVVHRRQCPACGDPADVPDPVRRLGTGRQPLLTRWDGGHRVEHAASTLARLAPQISPITGVVGELTKYEADSDLIHVYAASHPFGDPGYGLAGLRQLLDVGSAGKGKTDVQARVSAVGEAIERYSGVFTGSEDRTCATVAELGKQAVHPQALLHFSEDQYRTRLEWNRAHSGFAHVAEPFRADRPIDWTRAWSLTAEEVRYLPTAFCYYGYPAPADHRFCVADSNGTASGNTFEEATLQGFLELVERDCIAMWWYNRVRRPAVDLDAIDEPYVHALRREYGRRGREFWALDLTNDLGIPTVVAVSRRTDGSPEEIIQGYGSHLDPMIAVSRALTEMNQMLMLVGRSPLDSSVDPDNELWFRTAAVAEQPYLLPDPTASPVRLWDRPRTWTGDIRADVARCVDIVANKGMETIVLDQSRADTDLTVVKVVVPGLRHFWARFAPGRLYDVPAALGWVPRPLTEHELNPIPVSS